jgi:hypothetical protein
MLDIVAEGSVVRREIKDTRRLTLGMLASLDLLIEALTPLPVGKYVYPLDSRDVRSNSADETFAKNMQHPPAAANSATVLTIPYRK